MQDGNEADPCPEMFGIGGQSQQRLGGGLKEKLVAALLTRSKSSRSSEGIVKTTWKYGMGRRSLLRSWTHFSRGRNWQVGQCRLRQEWKTKCCLWQWSHS